MSGKKFSKLGLIMSLTYLALFLAAGLWAIHILVNYTSGSEFCGLPAIMVTLPWSVFITPLLINFGYVGWYEQFAGSPVVYGLFAMLGLLPAALINAGFLYFLGTISDQKKSERK